MNNMLYPKLAAGNLKKNSQTYIPYIITCILMIAMYYIMESLSLNKGLNDIQGSSTMIEILSLGCKIIAVFSFIFLFYTNSFLIKNRKKEFGLFNILGMEKKHIARIIGYESLFVTLISFLGGFFSGIVLDKLMYLLIVKIIKADIALGFYISYKAMTDTAIFFGILFILIFLNSLRIMHFAKPIELLKGGNTGEKEPKTKWLTAILGFGCLGAGYYIAVTVKNPVTALTLFFVAVLLVIAGTYFVFTAGSIAFLKILKKNKRYYYKTNHFISVSGMIYRMKQNAVGLANICILSTMVLVTVSTTTSLIIGIEDIIHERYPYQINIYKYHSEEKDNQYFSDMIENTIKKQNIAARNMTAYSSLTFAVIYDNECTFEASSNNGFDNMNNIYELFFITAEDYFNYTGEEAILDNSDEIYLWSERCEYKKDYLNLFGNTYKIVKNIDNKSIRNGQLSASICPACSIVVKDASVIENIYQKQKEVYGENASSFGFFYGIDINGDADAQIQFAEKLEAEVKDFSADRDIVSNLECREIKRESVYGLYGSIFFLGIFLGLLFTIVTVLIIYYKQISEGYDDKKRFEIMQKVGMTENEVKNSIHSQVLTVFFLPLVTAGIHTAFAFPIIRKILLMLMLTNTKLYIICTVISFISFAVIYGVIYMFTAGVYYKIVKK